jgi:hypothetical protein
MRKATLQYSRGNKSSSKQRIEKSRASNKENAFWLRKEAQLSVISCGYPSYKLDLKLLSFIRTLKGII